MDRHGRCSRGCEIYRLGRTIWHLDLSNLPMYVVSQIEEARVVDNEKYTASCSGAEKQSISDQ